MTEFATHAELQITAPRVAWRALGAETYSDGTVRTNTATDALLVRGVLVTGARDERAVAWALETKAQENAAQARAHAESELAKAVSELARVLGAESAEQLVARLPERIRTYAQTVLRSRS